MRSVKAVPEKALTIAGADRFTRRGGAHRLHAIYQPIGHKLGGTGGIVKHGGMSACPQALQSDHRKAASAAIRSNRYRAE